MEKIVNKASGLAITGLVMGICSIVLFWVPLVHFVLVVLGCIFGGIALSRKERFGLTGLLTSVLSYIPVIIYWIVLAAAMSTY